jgi:hypothetical protein
MKAIWNKSVAAAMLIAAMTMLSTAGLAQNKAPDATFRYSGATAAAGVGVSWGHGTLTFQGKDYPFRIRGIDVADVGITKITATGDVYNLQRAGDFAGTYGAASAGAALAAGGVGAVMKNDQGVIVRMASTSKGATAQSRRRGRNDRTRGPVQ